MKKKVWIALLVVLVLAGSLILPQMVKSTIPAAYYVTPNLKTYENIINCSGTVQSQDVRQIVLPSPLVPGEIYAEIGDVVYAGEALVKVDQEKTKEIGLSFGLLQDFSGSSNGYAMDTGSIEALLASYRYSSAIASSTMLDAESLAGLLNDGGLLATNTMSVLQPATEGEIRAPINGVVTALELQTGVPAMAGTMVATIADTQNYVVQTSIREEDVARVQEGDRATVRGVAFSGKAYEGVITKIYPTARKSFANNTAETVVDAEIVLKNPDRSLKPGFSAKVEILGESDYNLITIPYEAIRQDENNKEYVYLYENGKLKKQPVITGQELTSEVEILDGITYSSVVVYNPDDAVKEGAMVHLRGRANVA